MKFYRDESFQLICGDALESVRGLPAESVQCVVTSPPYWGLRDYGVDGQIGLEKDLNVYIKKLVALFQEIGRTLKTDGTLWLNMGDAYTSGGRKTRDPGKSKIRPSFEIESYPEGLRPNTPNGMKSKDLIGLPWRVAFALQAAGWYLRSDIVWSKPNPMPESVTDRPTRAHEYIFLLTKSKKYYYDAEAIREPAKESSLDRWAQDIAGQAGSQRANGGAKTNGTMKSVGGPKKDKQRGHGRKHEGFNARWDSMPRSEQMAAGANKRSVWTVATKPYPQAHFATFPPDLIKPCILAGSRLGDTVLDPFMGSGTTAAVALSHGRRCIGIELNPEYCQLAVGRVKTVPKMVIT